MTIVFSVYLNHYKAMSCQASQSTHPTLSRTYHAIREACYATTNQQCISTPALDVPRMSPYGAICHLIKFQSVSLLSYRTCFLFTDCRVPSSVLGFLPEDGRRGTGGVPRHARQTMTR